MKPSRQTIPTRTLSSPARGFPKCPNLRGLYFKAVAGGNMVAYEFTTDKVRTSRLTKTSLPASPLLFWASEWKMSLH
jgi:hypothetical protein